MRHNEVVQKLQSNFSTTKNLKESGIPWLGKIPKHWEVKRAKNIFREMKRPVKEGDEIITCFRDGIVTLRKKRRVEGFTNSLKEIGYQGIQVGDLVIHSMDAFAGAIGVSDSDGKATPVYIVCTPYYKNLAYTKYYAFLLRKMASSNFILSLAKGIRERSTDFRYSDFGDLRLPLPPFQEQKAITDFLDKKTHQIEDFITKKQKLITLLEEKKQTLINQCVTQGLDSSISLKDSGVEWLGKIPTHWEVLQLKFLGKLRGGDGFPHEYQGKNNYEFPFYKVGDLQKSKDGFFMSETENTISEEIGNIIRAKPFPKNTIVWAKIGEALCLNRRRVLKHVSYIDNNMTGFVIKQNVDLRYAFYLLSSVDLSLFINPSVVPSISEGTQALIRVPLPPLEEQKAIAEYLDTQIAKIDLAISKIKSQVNLIKEYKSTLISEAVCGRVGVD